MGLGFASSGKLPALKWSNSYRITKKQEVAKGEMELDACSTNKLNISSERGLLHTFRSDFRWIQFRFIKKESES